MPRAERWLVPMILLGAVVFFALPARRVNIDNSADWWRRWLIQAQTNYLPNQRGLNVAVLDWQGRLLTAAAFDTYLNPRSGFAEFITAQPLDSWVIVAAQDEASASLSEADLHALVDLGGSRSLYEKYEWSYVLVGRPHLGQGQGRELLSPNQVDLRLPAGAEIAGRRTPIAIRVRSGGFSQGSFAALQFGRVGYRRLWEWIFAVFR